MTDPIRCAWAEGDPVMAAYHDAEWGVPLRDGRALWEMLMLEGFQAGLSWRTILHRREGFRAAFAAFDPEAVARFTPADVDRLMADARIIRARAKIEATIGNARVWLAMRDAGEDFAAWAWALAGGAPRQGGLRTLSQAGLGRRHFRCARGARVNFDGIIPPCRRLYR